MFCTAAISAYADKPAAAEGFFFVAVLKFVSTVIADIIHSSYDFVAHRTAVWKEEIKQYPFKLVFIHHHFRL